MLGKYRVIKIWTSLSEPPSIGRNEDIIFFEPCSVKGFLQFIKEMVIRAGYKAMLSIQIL
jgi:hypothetical protein